MKRFLIFFASAALAFAGCAQETGTDDNALAGEIFDAWVQKHNDGWTATSLGSYIISSEEGEGDEAGPAETSPYVYLRYTTYDLDWNVQSTTDEMTARRCRIFSHKRYYGPNVFARADNAMYVGIDEIISTMKPGGKVRVVIPGWLFTKNRYSDTRAYLDNYDGSISSCIYDIELVEAIGDIDAWESAILEKFVSEHYPDAVSDTAGFHKVVLKAPEAEFVSDTTVYINYTGRLLDGHVFDTSIRDTANLAWKENFNPAASFAPQKIQWKKDYTEIRMGSSETTVIEGFAFLLGKMGVNEKALGIFHSKYGYGSVGSSDSGYTVIPSYCPLVFEVELTAAP